MSTIRVEASAEIDARPEAIYNILADYRVGHPAIVPKPYFGDIRVEQGGVGAGTIIDFDVTVMGQTMHYHQAITEPEPGRVLVETDTRTGQFSRFTVDPLDGGSRARVSILSEMPAPSGIAGLLARLTTPRIMRGMFQQELKNLAAYVQNA